MTEDAYELPGDGEDFLPHLYFDGGTLSLDLVSSAHAEKRVVLVFTKVRAIRYCAEVHATVFQIESAFDRVVEVVDSSWATEIRNRTASPWDRFWKLRHFMIYVNSAGAFEFLAEEYAVKEHF